MCVHSIFIDSHDMVHYNLYLMLKKKIVDRDVVIQGFNIIYFSISQL